MVGAHSMSEVLAGLLIGITVSAYAVTQGRLPRVKFNFYLPLVIVIWLVIAPLQTPQVPTHSLVTRFTLLLSGHAKPHTRNEMLRHGWLNRGRFNLTHHWGLLSLGNVPGASFQVNIKNSHRQDIILTQEEKRADPETHSDTNKHWTLLVIFVVGSIAVMMAADCLFAPDLINPATLPDAVGK
jgi:hypothetical protein